MPLVIHGVEFSLCLSLIQLLGKNSSYIEVKIAINFLYDSFRSLILFITSHENLCNLGVKAFNRFSLKVL